jgi:micrococcal nuclease
MSKAIIYLEIFCLCIFGAIGPVFADSQQRGLVTRVIDGDTIVVRIGSLYERVRLLGIDAPEIGRNDSPSQCHANQSARALQTKIYGKEVKLERDAVNKNRDTYGRLLRYVSVGNSDINADLLEDGVAKVYRRYEFSRREGYDKKENDAHSAHRGVWGCKK